MICFYERQSDFTPAYECELSMKSLYSSPLLFNYCCHAAAAATERSTLSVQIHTRQRKSFSTDLIPT
jgi:hypothetical protein